uniref:Uncharacterized protein n=1 Tax=Arundo donax TaxID=35708 RepID=A0A0A9F1U4_ARUDO
MAARRAPTNHGRRREPIASSA